MDAYIEAIRTLTPLNSFENRRLELLREPGMHCPSFGLFTFNGLEIIQTTLPCYLTLKLF